MGYNAATLARVSVMVPLSLCLATLSAWFTWLTLLHVRNVMSESNMAHSLHRASTVNSSIWNATTNHTIRKLSPFSCKLNLKHMTVRLTLIANAAFTLSNTFRFLRACVTIDRLRKVDENQAYDTFQRVNSSPTIRALFLCSLAMHLCGWVSTIVICFERMRHTFHTTAEYRLSERTVRMFRCYIVSFSIVVPVSVALFYTISVLIGILMGLSMILCYPMVSLWVVWRFQRTTMDIARNLVIYRRKSAMSKQRDSNERTNEEDRVIQRAEELMNVAMRLTIVTTVAVMSSCVLMLVFVLNEVTKEYTLITLTYFSYAIDACINSFSLLCTFVSSEKYYTLVYGRLHQFLFARMVTDHTTMTNYD